MLYLLQTKFIEQLLKCLGHQAGISQAQTLVKSFHHCQQTRKHVCHNINTFQKISG